MRVLDIIHEACENVAKKMSAYNDTVRQRGDMSNSEIEAYKTLACTLKDLKTAYAMAEQEEMQSSGYSGRYMGPYSWDDGYSYRNNYPMQNRDSRGRYSRSDEVTMAMDSLRNNMASMPEDKRREVQAFIDRMERL